MYVGSMLWHDEGEEEDGGHDDIAGENVQIGSC